MEMMNRAIEDASDFREVVRKLQEPLTPMRSAILDPVFEEARKQAARIAAKRPGENRAQHRARVFGKAKA